MKIIEYPSQDSWRELLKRPTIDTRKLGDTVAEIIADVRQNGDAALRRYAREFDSVDLDDLRVSEQEFLDAEARVPQDLKDAVSVAKANIERFHSAMSAFDGPVVETVPGVTCWTRSLPIEKVGLYIPAGSAPLFSTVLMLAIPAMLAGSSTIVMCSPPDSTGKVNPRRYMRHVCAG